MQIEGNKKVVCITGSVWTGRRSAPRYMLVREGFLRPTWFTTGRPLTDADYRQISNTQYLMAKAKTQVLAHIKYRASFIGVMQNDFKAAIGHAKRGVLLVPPPRDSSASGRAYTLNDCFFAEIRGHGSFGASR